MERNKRIICTLSALGMGILIWDRKTAVESGIEGIRLCLQTVIPSLFPFFILSILLTDNLSGSKHPGGTRMERILRLPSGSGLLVITGLLGGYPVGAKVIGASYTAGRLTKTDAQRLAVFCNAPGPAFLFGMVGTVLGSIRLVWILWAIIILSAAICTVLLPGSASQQCTVMPKPPVSIQTAANKALRMMGSVCTWIMLFRIVTGYILKWMPQLPTPSLRSLIIGILELSNGIVSLREMADPAARFLLCSFLLPLGGVCVWMQTVSVFPELSMGNYLAGKLFQSAVSFLLASGLQMLIAGSQQYQLPYPCLLLAFMAAAGSMLFLINKEKSSRFPGVIGV